MHQNRLVPNAWRTPLTFALHAMMRSEYVAADAARTFVYCVADLSPANQSECTFCSLVDEDLVSVQSKNQICTGSTHLPTSLSKHKPRLKLSLCTAAVLLRDAKLAAKRHATRSHLGEPDRPGSLRRSAPCLLSCRNAFQQMYLNVPERLFLARQRSVSQSVSEALHMYENHDMLAPGTYLDVTVCRSR